MVKGGGMYCIPLGSIGFLLVCTRVSVVAASSWTYVALNLLHCFGHLIFFEPSALQGFSSECSHVLHH